MTKANEVLIAERRAQLLAMIEPGDTVYTVLKHVSSSGMMRVIDLVIPYMADERRSVYDAPASKFKPGAEVWDNTPDGRGVAGSASVISRDGDAVTIRYNYRREGEEATRDRKSLTLIETRKRPALRSISGLAADLLGYKWDDRGGLKIGGCGMDMGFHAVYGLGSMLWPNGTKKPHSSRNGEPDRAGGYALKHRWL